MEIENTEMNLKLDWESLDKRWAEQYEEDYGHFFIDIVSNKITTPFYTYAESVPTHIEASAASSF